MLHKCTKNPFEKARDRGKDLQGHSRSLQLLLRILCPISRHSNIIVLHRFRDTATFAVYLTASDLESSFIFYNKVEIISCVRF